MKIFISVLLLVFFHCVQAQNMVTIKSTIDGNELSRVVSLHQRFDISYNLFSRTTSNQEAAQYVRDATYLTLNNSELTRILDYRPEALLLQIPNLAGGTQNLRLVQHFPAESDAVVRVFDKQGSYTTSLAPSVHYRGIIEGDNKSLVALSINENNVTAIISSNLGNVVLTKLDNKSSRSNEWILYLDANLQLPRVFSCGQGDLPELPATHPIINTGERSTNCVKVHFVCDYALFQQFGSVAAVSNYVTNLYNAVATLYQNEAIPTQISQIDVYSTVDPYTSYASSCDILNPFGAAMSSNGMNGDLAHFLSGRSIGGGCAWLDVLCGIISYRVAVSGIDGAFSPVPTYSWDVNVVTHEMGHNLGSHHTHDCVWNGNNTAIDGCGPTAGYPGGTCATAALPTNGGTIMSYCHLLPTGINFSNGFGTQPGNLIRNRVDNASCLVACSNTACPTTRNLTTAVSNGDYEASSTITASNTLSSGQSVEYDAASSITLQPGFWAQNGTDFHAVIEGCGGVYMPPPPNNNGNTDFHANQLSVKTDGSINTPADTRQIFPNPIAANQTLHLNFGQPIKTVQLLDITGKQIYYQKLETDTYQHALQSPAVNGIYLLQIITEQGNITQKVVVQ